MPDPWTRREVIGNATLYCGDALGVLSALPSASVHCCVTSPPYWGLRDYGIAEQIGLEATPAEYVARMVEVFREVRRVLRDDGTLWLNLGDSYSGSGKGGNPDPGSSKQATNAGSQSIGVLYGKTGETAREAALTNVSRRWTTEQGIAPKNLIGIPWRVAFALQQPYYTGAIRDERDRIWLAAIIDGEGCFFIHKRKAGTPSYSKFTRADGSEANYERTADTYGVGLEICNTNAAIIDRVAQIVGGGTFTEQSPQQNNRRKQTIYRWRVAPNEAKRIAQEVYPHLVAKQHQARLLFNCPSSGEAGDAAHQGMMNLHNGRETTVDYPLPPSMFEPGWYLRQDVIWSKKNPMPESVRDRCTKAHEYIFLLSKSEKYHFDNEAIKEDCVQDESRPTFRGGDYVNNSTFDNAEGGKSTDTGNVRRSWKGSEFQTGKTGEHQLGRSQKVRSPAGWKTGPGAHGSIHDEGREQEVTYNEIDASKRNKRSVWTVATQPFYEAHFATFPPKLIEPCVLAGCPVDGTLLDPFAGSGTSGEVALLLSRQFIGIELNETYFDSLLTTRITNAQRQERLFA